MDSIVFYQPPMGIKKRNLKGKYRDTPRDASSLAKNNAYGRTRSVDAANIHGLPLPQDKTEEGSGRHPGHFAAINASRYQISDGGSSSDDLLSGVKKPEIQTGQSEGFSSSMRKHPWKHPQITLENLELSQGLRAKCNNYAIGTNQDAAIVLSDCDSDDNDPRASSGSQDSYSLRASRYGRPEVSTDDFLEPVSSATQRSAPSSPGHRNGSRRNASTPKTSPRVAEQRNDDNHRNHDKAATSVLKSTSGNFFEDLSESRTEVATDNSIAYEDDRKPSEFYAVEEIQDQSTPETGTTSKSILMRGMGNDGEHARRLGHQGTDFVSRLPREQRNQYAPLGSRQGTLQKKRTRAASEDGLDPKRIRSRLERRVSIPTSHRPPPEDPEDCQYLVERLLKKRTRKHSKKSVTQFLVRWLGYEEDEDCWVDEEDIHPGLVENFMVSY